MDEGATDPESETVDKQSEEYNDEMVEKLLKEVDDEEEQRRIEREQLLVYEEQMAEEDGVLLENAFVERNDDEPIENLPKIPRTIKRAHCNLDEPYKRYKMKSILLNLHEISEETKNFLLGKWQIEDENSEPVSETRQRSLINTFHNHGYFNLTLNEAQISAILNCSLLPISFIWGPPGTGKTTTIAYQAVYEILTRIDRRSAYDDNDVTIVLLGPSQEAANNLFEKVCDILDRNENNEIKVIRVFSSDVEQVEFPYKKGKKKRMDDPCETKRLGTLLPKYTSRWAHHLIREVQETQEYATYLRKYDEKFAEIYGEQEFDEDKIFHYRSEYMYKQVRDRAERIVICKSSIIVSTVNAFNYERYNMLQQIPPTEQENQSDQNATDNRDDDEDVFNDDDVMLEIMRDVKVTITEAYRNAKPIFVRRIIFDEATLEPESETLVALQAAKRADYTFAGERYKLDPVVKCPETKLFGALRSLEANEEKRTMLTTQYRMNKWIQEYPNKSFYDGKLQIGNETEQNFLKIPDFWNKFYDPGEEVKPVLFINHSGIEQLAENEADDGKRSFFNLDEIGVAANIARYLIEKEHVVDEKICIITIYSAQQKTIVAELERRNLRNVVAETVRTAQGKEWDYILFSCVKSKQNPRETDGHAAERYDGNLGLLGFENDFNVAITRAKHGLIIIGNEKVLSKNKDVLLPWLNEAKRVNWNDYQQDFENYIVP